MLGGGTCHVPLPDQKLFVHAERETLQNMHISLRDQGPFAKAEHKPVRLL